MEEENFDMMAELMKRAASAPPYSTAAHNTGRSGNRWESQVVCVTAVSAYALAKLINDYYSGKFVVGTHTFEPKRQGDPWTALIYFKVRK